MGRLLRLLAPLWGWITLSALLGFATVASGIGLLATAAYIIASAALHPSVADLAVAIVGVRFFGISRGAFRYLERYVSHNTTFLLLSRLRVRFYEALEPLVPARTQSQRSGDILTRLVADVEALQHFYVRVVGPAVVAVLVMLLMWFLMGSFDQGLAWVTVGFLLAAGLALPLLTHFLGAGSAARLAKTRAEVTTEVVEGIQGMADLLAYGQEERQAERVQGLNRAWLGEQRRQARLSGLHGGLSVLVANGALWVVVVLGISLVAGGRLDGRYLPVLALAALASFEAVAPLPQALQYLGTSLESARRLFSLLDAQPAVIDPPAPSPAPAGFDLRARDLRFRYGPDEPLALDGVSFDLPEGRRLAIVGPSGAGKSTLVQVLLRFWDCTDGEILLAGRDLREYRQEDARRLFAVVSQRTHLFNASIRDNLLIARPGASEEEMVRAAERAQLHSFVQTLPRGYDTWVGEQGLSLSGGERQRVAIARALLKDAPILILDEATAHLDSLHEREVTRALRTLMEGRTTLTITHRLVGLAEMDEIIVLQAGRVVEHGREAELLAAGGLYRRLFHLQNQALAIV
ncbi:MAG: thiol reductant ABC exporter subunit CydC [Dehalococcoidales bacterium]|nr:thiol reductant ABC exporter subunit CydC [Dehalococcoidales bacterium]